MSIVSQLTGSLAPQVHVMHALHTCHKTHMSQDAVNGGTWAAMRAGMAAGSTFHTSCCTVISSTSARGSAQAGNSRWK